MTNLHPLSARSATHVRWCTAVACCFSACALRRQPRAFPLRFGSTRSESLGPLKPIWRFFGADEPNYATMPNGKKLLGELGELQPDSVYFRTHNLLTTGDGTPALKWGSTNAYREDASGKPIYDWTILDRIFDTYRDRGVRPYVQIRLHAAGSVDEARAVSAPVDVDGPVRRDLHRLGLSAEGLREVGGAGLPVGEALRRAIRRRRSCDLVLGNVERGEHRLLARHARGVSQAARLRHRRRAARLPNAKVGGPDTAGSGGDFTRDFLEHCLRGKNYATGEIGTPLDFVSFHAKGAPRFVEDDADGHVRMGIAKQLRTIDDGFRIVASFPELKETPIVIGESDPEGCAACQGPQLAYRNGTMYSSYTAAVLRPQARPRRPARRESRRGAHLGVRVRGPAVLRRLPLAGDQRHRQAGAQRLPHVRQDERRAAWRSRATAPFRSTR